MNQLPNGLLMKRLVKLRMLLLIVACLLSGCGKSAEDEARAAIEALGGKYFTDSRGYINTLFVNDTQITDNGLEKLKGLSSLEFLALNGTQITDGGLEHLKELTRLHTLWLANTQITDAGLEHLEGLTSLEVLTLDNTQISDAGVIHVFNEALTAYLESHEDVTIETVAGRVAIYREGVICKLTTPDIRDFPDMREFIEQAFTILRLIDLAG